MKLTSAQHKLMLNALRAQTKSLERAITVEKDDAVKALRQSTLDENNALIAHVSNLELFK